MKKFFLKIFVLTLINIILYNVIVFIIYGKSIFTSICTAPRNESYDFILLGTSHGQVFYKEIVEAIIPKKMRNLSTGAAGVIVTKIKLECFFQTESKTRQIIYLLDPWTLYSKRWNEDNYILEQSNIEFSYLLKLIENNVSKKVLFNYFRNKLIDNYDRYMRKLLTNPTETRPKEIMPVKNVEKNKDIKPEENLDKKTVKYETIIPDKAVEEQRISNKATDRQRLEVLYNEGENSKSFARYSKEVEKIISVSKKNNAEIIFIVLPTLMGKMPGHENTLKLLSEYQKKYGIKYYDLSAIMQEPDFYWDREHLTEKGVKYFTKNYLSKLVD